MKIAVVGTGISGMVAARKLHAEHDVTVFEAADWIGGHTNTVNVEGPEGTFAIDTGFIVFNQRTYPHFCALLRELGVDWQESDMSFSVRCQATGLEYNGSSLDKMLARRSNALRPSFWRMVRDILRFYREAPRLLEGSDDGLTLGSFLERGGYSRAFVEQHLVPMGAAVWSTRPAQMLEFPARFLVQFFHNHGFLAVEGRPQWLVVRGGSREYVKRLVAPFRERIRLRTPVVAVRRTPLGVSLRTAAGEEAFFDRVVLATHADSSRAMLQDASAREREILGAFEYQANEAVLHTDATLMPRRRRAWASWNYHVAAPPAELPTVTYWMNRLQPHLPQGREAPPLFVSLNPAAAPRREHLIRTEVYEHPSFDAAAIAAQRELWSLQGERNTWFCGAYFGSGFHEDGLQAGLAVAEALGGVRRPWTVDGESARIHLPGALA